MYYVWKNLSEKQGKSTEKCGKEAHPNLPQKSQTSLSFLIITDDYFSVWVSVNVTLALNEK